MENFKYGLKSVRDPMLAEGNDIPIDLEERLNINNINPFLSLGSNILPDIEEFLDTHNKDLKASPTGSSEEFCISLDKLLNNEETKETKIEFVMRQMKLTFKDIDRLKVVYNYLTEEISDILKELEVAYNTLSKLDKEYLKLIK
jgi:hypothetical protein